MEWRNIIHEIFSSCENILSIPNKKIVITKLQKYDTIIVAQIVKDVGKPNGTYTPNILGEFNTWIKSKINYVFGIKKPITNLNNLENQDLVDIYYSSGLFIISIYKVTNIKIFNNNYHLVLVPMEILNNYDDDQIEKPFALVNKEKVTYNLLVYPSSIQLISKKYYMGKEMKVETETLQKDCVNLDLIKKFSKDFDL